jgi:hypothetical protein
MLDHGDRIGTVVDLLVGVNAGKSFILLDRTNNDQGAYGYLSPAWYLFGALQPRVDKGLGYLVRPQPTMDETAGGARFVRIPPVMVRPPAEWDIVRGVLSTYVGRCTLRHFPARAIEAESEAGGVETVAVRPERRS